MSNLNSIYPIYNHLCQPSSHHNHPDKLLIQTMIQLLSQHTSPLAHQKICTNLGILGNEAADKLAKFGANPLQTYPPPSCNLYQPQEKDTCLHLPFVWTKATLNNIQTTRHNKVVWHIHKLLLCHSPTRTHFQWMVAPTLEASHITKVIHGYTHAFATQDHVNALLDSNLTSWLSPNLLEKST